MDLNITDESQKPLITFGKKLILFRLFLKTIEFKDIDILCEPLWYNNKVKIQNKFVFCKTFYEQEFNIAFDLFDTQDEFIS